MVEFDFSLVSSTVFSDKLSAFSNSLSSTGVLLFTLSAECVGIVERSGTYDDDDAADEPVLIGIVERIGADVRGGLYGAAVRGGLYGAAVLGGL